MKLLGRHSVSRAAILAIALGTILAVGQSAHADTLAVSADLPVSMSISAKSSGTTHNYNDSSVSGLGVGLSLPFLIGLGYENYSGAFSGAGNRFNYGVTMYDLFLNLPIPVVNIAIGAGVGNGSIGGGNVGSSYKDASLTQWFASLGVPILPLLDIHVGYHAFSGTNDAKTAGKSNISVNGDMWSLGLKLGF